MVRVFDEDYRRHGGNSVASPYRQGTLPRNMGRQLSVIFMIGEKVIARKNFSVKGQAVQFVPVVKAETEVSRTRMAIYPAENTKKAAE